MYKVISKRNRKEKCRNVEINQLFEGQTTKCTPTVRHNALLWQKPHQITPAMETAV